MATTKTPVKKPAAKKPSAPKKIASKPTTKKPAAKKATAKKPYSKARNIGGEERYRMVEVAAYYIAERNGFKGSSTDYRIAAEAEIAKVIGK